MTLRTEHVTKEVLDPFKLELPEPFIIEPAHTVALSKTRTAYIYAVDIKTEEYIDGKSTTIKVPGWRIVVKTQHGIIDHGTFTDNLLVCLHLQAQADEYAKKRRTTVEENDSDD